MTQGDISVNTPDCVVNGESSGSCSRCATAVNTAGRHRIVGPIGPVPRSCGAGPSEWERPGVSTRGDHVDDIHSCRRRRLTRPPTEWTRAVAARGGRESSSSTTFFGVVAEVWSDCRRGVVGRTRWAAGSCGASATGAGRRWEEAAGVVETDARRPEAAPAAGRRRVDLGNRGHSVVEECRVTPRAGQIAQFGGLDFRQCLDTAHPIGLRFEFAISS